MRTSLLHVVLLMGAFCTFAFSNPAEFNHPENPDWCFSTVKFKNTGCQKVKIYKKQGSYLYLYKTLNTGSSYNQSTYYGHKWVFKVNGNYWGSYTVSSCSFHTYEINTEGCGGNSECDNIPNNLSGLMYMGEYNGSKYFCSDDNNNNWDEATANNAATQLGGHLVTINDAAENEFVRNGIMADRVWIGFTDKNSEGDFKWVNGDPVTYTNWSYGEPNNQGVSGGQGDYTVLEKSSGKWKDRHGNDHYEYVIEVPCKTEPVCTGEITGLKIYDINNGNKIDLTDGASFQLNELPDNYNIEAMIGGNAESVRFFLNGTINDTHTENVFPYRFNGDNNPLSLIAGNYSLTVKAYSKNSGGGEVCDEKTIHFTVKDDPVCTGGITGLKIFNLDGGNNVDLIDGATYGLNQLPDNFNIEAMVSGNSESVKFFLSGDVNDTHTENVSPYRFNGDNNPLALSVGNYSLTVRAYSENQNQGEICDEVTVHFSITNQPPSCVATCSRDVFAIESCSGKGPYTIYLENANGGNYFDGGGQTWEECEDGTIHYFGTATKAQGSTDDDFISFDLYFSGKTNSAPAGSPKENACFGFDASTFVYYTQTFGTITSPNHGTIQVVRRGPAFQLGLGANHQTPDFGASGWLDFVGGSDYYEVGDVNVKLSPTCDVCLVNDFEIVCEYYFDVTGWGEIDGCEVKVCEGDKVMLSVNPNLPTTWTGPNGFTGDNNDIIVSESVTLSDAGNYVATVNNNGCIKTQTLKLIVKENPDVDVQATDLTCGQTDGIIQFFFNDNPNRTNIEFSIDGGNTYPLNVADNSGTALFTNLPAGSYDAFVRWGNNECAVGLGVFTLEVPADDDHDGVCNPDDCFPFDPSLPADPGTPCDDGDANTENDVIQADRCSCAGELIPPPCDNIVMGGTIGFLGSCSPNIVYCKEDGDAPLIQDCFSPIGGTGQLEVVWLKSTTSCLPPTTTFDNIENDPHWVVIAGANSLDYQPGVPSESTCFLRCSRRENCDTFIESNIVRIVVNCDLEVDCSLLDISTDVGKIIVSGLDQAPLASVQVFSTDYNTTFFTCPGNCDIPTQIIELADGDYIVAVKLFDEGFNLICEIIDTYTVPPCENVGLGGFIGFGNCLADYLHCPLDGPAPPIVNCGTPEGGAGDLEIVWLRSTTSCLPPTTTFENIANDPHWEVIPGENGLGLSVGDVQQNTCYLRCARRAGCDTFVESNIISLTINTDCIEFDRFGVSIGDRVWDDLNGNGVQDDGEPGLENVWINLQDGNGNSIYWVNTDENGEFIFFGLTAGTYQLQFSTPAGYEVTMQNSTTDTENDSDIDPVFSTSPILNLLEGDHPRDIDAGFRLAGQFLANHSPGFQFKVVKAAEHTELYWVHNDGENVIDFTVERAVNGGAYEALNRHSSRGGTAPEVYFDFDTVPATGDNLYRIKLVYQDGTIGYSDPLLVHFADLIDFTVFPNPAGDFIKINLESLLGKQVEIQLINTNGTIVHREEISEVYSKYFQLDLRDLLEGHYVIWLSSPGHKAVAEQFIVGKPK